MSNIFDYFGHNKSVTDPDYNFDRSLGGQTLQDTLNWLYAAARGPAQNLMSLVPEVLATSAGMASPWHTGAQGRDWWRERGIQPFQPHNESQQEAMSFLGAAPERLEELMRSGAQKVEDVTGSEMAGALAYTAPMFAPYGWMGKILSGKAGRFGINPPIQSVAENMNIRIDRRGGGRESGFYSTKPGEREKAIAVTGSKAARDAAIQALDPKAAARLRQLGLSLGDWKQFSYAMELLEKGKSETWAKNHIASQLRKAHFFANKYRPEGKPAQLTSSLAKAISPFSERMEVIKGIPSVDQMNKIVGKTVQPEFMQVLLDGMVGNRGVGLSPNDTVLYTSWTNPHNWLGFQLGGKVGGKTSGVHAFEQYVAYLLKNDIPVNAENINKRLAIDRAQKYRKIGQVKYDYQGNRLEPPKKEGGGRGAPIDWEAYAEMDGVWRHDPLSKQPEKKHFRVAVPAKARDVMIDGNPYIFYQSSVLTPDELIAGVGNYTIFDPNTGRSRILVADELDLASGRGRSLLEMPAQRRVVTVYYHDRVPDKTLQPYYPTQKNVTKQRATPDPLPAIKELYEEGKSVKPTASDIARHPFVRGGAIHATAVESGNEDRKARNIY